MEVVRDLDMLRHYVEAAEEISPERPILIDKFLENATECEADAIADGHDAFVPSIMEHIELCGIHSGDSACVIPPISIPQKHIDTLREYTARIAREMHVVGLMNMQYAICDDTVYVIEANPRASRTVPLVSKVCGISMARLATQMMMGKRLADLDLREHHFQHYGVKEAVFPFPMLPEVDPVLGPEMRSTGEVLGLAPSFGLAYYKAQEGAKSTLPQKGTVLITVNPEDRQGALEVARTFAAEGFSLRATEGTCRYLNDNGVRAEVIHKINEGRPNIVDAIKNGEIQLVVNTPIGKASNIDDSYIRKNAIRYGVPYITTIAAAKAAGRHIFPCQCMRWRNYMQQAKRLIDDGELGDVYFSDIAFIRRIGIPTWGMFHMREHNFGGPFCDLGVHLLDSLLWLVGSPKVLSVSGSTFTKIANQGADVLLSIAESGAYDGTFTPRPYDYREFNVEDFATGFMRLSNGMAVNFKFSWAINLPTTNLNMVLCGDQGGLYVNNETLYRNVGRYQAETKLKWFDNGKYRGRPFEQHWYMYEHILDVLDGKADYLITEEQNLEITKAIECFYRSAETAREVTPDELL